MNKEALIAWTSLYIAVGIMALICAVLAVGVTADDWRTKRWRPSLATHFDKMMLLPRIWLRWQVNYMKGAPVILAISFFYAWSVDLSVFWDL